MPKRAIPYTLDDFYSHTTTKDGDDCLYWTAEQTTFGYPYIAGRGVSNLATRWLVKIMTGRDIPEGMYVCHKCDHPLCAKYEHLFLDSQKGNLHDMANKGRAVYPPKGFRIPQRTLSNSSIIEIRNSKKNNKLLASQYGVGIRTIRRIKLGQRYSNII